MNLKGTIKKYAVLIGMIAIVNQCAFPICTPVKSLMKYESNLKTDHIKLVGYCNLPSDFGALDYLNLASSLVHNDAHGRGVCRDYVIETYNDYMALLEQNKRNDLKRKIRTATGPAKDASHMWLEIEIDKEFIPYESTSYTPKLKTSVVKYYSRISLDKRMELDGCAKKEKAFFHSFRGKLLEYPTLRSFIYPGGLIRAVYEALKY